MNAIRAIVFALATLIMASAPAKAAPCPGLVVRVHGGADWRWPALSERIRREFAGRNDVDPCARVSVTTRGSSPLVTVTLPDGRLAGRSVSQPDEVIPVLAALLLVPEAPTSASVATPSAAAGSSATTGGASPEAPGAPSSATAGTVVGPQAALAVSAPQSVGPDAGAVRLDLSLAIGARVGDGQAGVGLGLSSFVELAAWLAGFQARVDSYQDRSASPTTGALEFAALGGRRLRLGTLALDFLAGPALALQGVAKSVKQVGSTDPAVTTSPTVEPRLLASSRLTFRAQSTVRTFVGLDGVVALTDARTQSTGLAPLPAWTVGLVLGVTVGTR